MTSKEMLIEALGRCGRAFTIVDVARALRNLDAELDRSGDVSTLHDLRTAVGQTAATRLD